jgi:membrane associated rhomboid family serine protease
MTLFLLLGPILEEKYGSKKLLVMMLITAVVSGLANILLFSNVALLGASGIVFMMIILTSASCIKDDRIPLTMILIIVIYLGAEVINGIFTSDNISQLTHIIGGVCGGVFGISQNRTPKE